MSLFIAYPNTQITLLLWNDPAMIYCRLRESDLDDRNYNMAKHRCNPGYYHDVAVGYGLTIFSWAYSIA